MSSTMPGGYPGHIDIESLNRTVTFRSPTSLTATLEPLRRGPVDPTCRTTPDGAWWRTSRQEAGPVTVRLEHDGPSAVRAQAWGPGAAEFLENLPRFLGAHDNWSDAGCSSFVPTHPVVAEAARRAAQLRLGRTDRVLEALVPAIIEQRVPGADAFRSWRRLLAKFGDEPPGPAPSGMRVFPEATVWQRIPSWEFHRANVDPGRARTVVECARRADGLERLCRRAPAEARAALTSLPGVGIWTAAETAQRAFGDPDALSVGDYHLSTIIGDTLLGHPVDDDRMIELLEPMRPHRHRVVRLLEVSGLAVAPRRGPRLPVQDISVL